MSKYTVKKNDYLIKIAREKGVTLKELIDANPQIDDPNLIHPGDSINIPETNNSGGQSVSPTQLANLLADATLDAGMADPDAPMGVSVPTQKRFIKGHHGRYHKRTSAFVESKIDGVGHKALSEPVPKYFARPGDGILRADGFTKGSHDNNTMIIMGRDRNGLKEVDSSERDLVKSDSGRSTMMGAGAIDIVVGRMSPFPLDIEGKTWSPLFNTKHEIDALKIETLEGTDPENNNKPFFTNHPAYVMDAARIYLSQFTDIDENFRIQKQIFVGGTVKQRLNKKTPCSGIMLKADKVRLHARQDIKIVTGGSEEQENSAGNDITEIGGIHLMAGNESLNQQPIPLGNNLAYMLDEMSKQIEKLSSIVFSFVDSQMKYNATLATHFHHSPFFGIATTPSLTAGPHGATAVVDQGSRVAAQILFLKQNMAAFRARTLKRGAANYINSKYNTTN